jgi:hypothetical protein
MPDPAPIDIPGGNGQLSIAPQANAPLLVVFGGIDVGGRPSGVYMWDYVKSFTGRFHIFVAKNPSVNGTKSYKELMSTLKAQGGGSPSQQILYLFSGGYLPGMDLLQSVGAAVFSSIYLVDIWMGNKQVQHFYKALVDNNSSKVTYVYTNFGANNDTVRDYLAKNASKAILVPGRGMDVHMSTNTKAVAQLAP